MSTASRWRKLVRAALALVTVACVLGLGLLLASRSGALQKARAWMAARLFGEVNAANTVVTAVDPELFNIELIRHGRIVQVRGQTSPDATVMINSYGIAYVDQGGRFSYYLDQLDPGEQLITVTAQTPQGGVATFQQTIAVEESPEPPASGLLPSQR